MADRDIETAFPLTPLQEGMLYHTIRHPGSSVYRGQVSADLGGPLDEEIFKRAWQLAAERHQAFRSFYAWERRERPLQVVRAHVELAWSVLDWSDTSGEEQHARWLELLEADGAQAFDLTAAPLMRFTLVHLSAEQHRLLWSLHHALADGWSGMLVMREVIEDYQLLRGGSLPDRPVPPSFATFITWLASRDASAAESYWRNELSGFVQPTALPSAEGHRPGSARATAEIVLDDGGAPALTSAAARLRVTPNTLAVGAWALVLSRHDTRSHEVVFGVTISERPPEIEGVERSVGLYLNTVPVRVGLPRDQPVGDWLSELQGTLSDGRDQSAGGLSECQRWSEVAHKPDLVRSLVVYESFPPQIAGRDNDGDLRLEATTISAPSDLPLALLVYPGERLMLQLVYDTALYGEASAHRLLAQAGRALMALTDPENKRLRDVDVVGPEDRSVLLNSWNRAEAPPPSAPDVLELIEAQAAASPDAIAARAAEVELTYAELDLAGNRLAHRILGEGLEPGCVLGISAVRSIETVIAVIAALKSGYPYTLFDPEQPEARLHEVLRPVDYVLGGPPRTGVEKRSLEIASSDQGRSTKPDVRVSTDAVAYVTWTSGSTGTPKGVVVERGHLARSTAARLDYYAQTPERFLLLSPLAVDSAVAGFYWTLCSGGCLILPHQRAEQDLEGLLELIEQEVVTTTLLVPSLYRTILQEADPGRLRSLRTVVVAGESCPPGLVTDHHRRLPDARLFNEYGPSEITVWATVAELTPDTGVQVTIGRPVPFARVYVLDPDGHPAPMGAPGELYLGGDTVARGYLDQSVLTAERFVEDPFRAGGRMYRTGDRVRFLTDGRLEFLGRFDDQLKVRGYRVEPAEIERVLESDPGIEEAAVAMHATPSAKEIDAAVGKLLDEGGDDAESLLAELLQGL